MSEWLTTGEMIDRMEIGEVARGVDAFLKEYYVTMTEDGMYFCDSTGDVRGYLEFTLNHDILNAKWQILPRYVSFEEAMKALKEGKRVALYIGSYKETFSLDEELDSLTLRDLIEGKWTIEE